MYTKLALSPFTDFYVVLPNNNSGFYFVTFTVWRWYYLFDRINRWPILADSLKENILRHEPDVLKLFLDEEKKYQFWQKTNMTILIESEKVALQKLRYIEENPVRKGYVEKAEYWFWSSANPKCGVKIEELL